MQECAHGKQVFFDARFRADPDFSSNPFRGGGGGDETQDTPTQVPTTLPTPTATEEATAEPPGVLTGTWELTIRVTSAGGVCQGEAFDPPYLEEIKIVQTGEGVTVTGIVDAVDPLWEGTFEGTKLSFEGSKARHTLTGSPNDARHGPGVTTSTFSLTYDEDTDRLRGSESWSWSGDAGSCEEGKSDITGRRITRAQVTDDSPPEARLAALAEGTDYPDTDTVSEFAQHFDEFRRYCPEEADDSLMEYVLTTHQAFLDAGVEQEFRAALIYVSTAKQAYPRMSCPGAVAAMTANIINFKLTGTLTPFPTQFPATAAAENKPRLAPMFPEGTEFTLHAAYLDIENRGHAEAAFLFAVAPGIDVLAPVSGTVWAALDTLLVLTDDATGAQIVISAFSVEPGLEFGDHINLGARIGSVLDTTINTSKAAPPVQGTVRLTVAIAAPDSGTRTKLDITLDPDSWWE